MSTKTTGAEYKAYLNETDSLWWPEGAYMDDEVLLVDGISTEDDYSFDAQKLGDNAKVMIEYGNYYAKTHDDPIALETHFKRWRKAQTTARGAFECPKDKLDAVISAIKAAGGKTA